MKMKCICDRGNEVCGVDVTMPTFINVVCLGTLFYPFIVEPIIFEILRELYQVMLQAKSKNNLYGCIS